MAGRFTLDGTISEQNSGRGPFTWISRLLLVAGVAVTIYGLVARRGILHPPWQVGDAKWILIFAASVILAASLTFLLLRSFARIVALLLLVAFVLVGAGVLPVLAALFFAVSAAALGDLVIRRSDFGRQPLLAYAVSTTIGLGLVAATVAILVHFPVNRIWLYIPLLAIPPLVNARRVIWYMGAFRTWLTASRQDGAGAYWVGALLLAVLAMHLVCVVQPETGCDALAAHLMVASNVASHGRWSFDYVHYSWALWPIASDWLSTVGWILGGEIAARLMNFTSFLLVLAMLHSLTVRISTRSIGRLVVALFASTSLAFGLTQNTFTEMTLTAFAFGAFVVIAGVGGPLSRSRLVAAGILMGACLLSKASAIYLVLPLAILLVVICVRQRGLIKSFAYVGGAGAVCLAVGASAYIYAYTKTGNPVFPLYNDVFKSPDFPYPAATFTDGRWVGHFSWLLPYRMTFASSGYSEVSDGAMGFQYLLLCPAGLAAALVTRKKTLLMAAAVSLVAALILLVNTQYIRYLFPALAIGMLVCAGVFVHLPGQKTLERRAIIALGLAVVGLNLYFLPAGAFNWTGFRLGGVFSPAARRSLQVAYAPQRLLNDVVNAEAGKSARVAYFGAPYGAGLRGTPIYANTYDPQLFFGFAHAKTRSDVMALFAAERVGYVIYGDNAPLVWGVLKLHATEVASVNGAVLFKLDRPGRPSHTGLVRLVGWYGDDWIGREAEAGFMARTVGAVAFDGLVPSFISSNHVVVRLNGKTVFAGDITGGSVRSFAGRLRKGENDIVVRCSQAVAPASVGVGSDARPLALHLTVNSSP
jgi:4-amino-4-deoxy-L-arabinose transferase-like glycosyltransferase